VIVTYWRSFADHDKSHADATFSTEFEALAKMCTDTKALGYDCCGRERPTATSACRAHDSIRLIRPDAVGRGRTRTRDGRRAR
jgi:hypothetical protein